MELSSGELTELISSLTTENLCVRHVLDSLNSGVNKGHILEELTILRGDRKPALHSGGWNFSAAPDPANISLPSLTNRAWAPSGLPEGQMNCPREGIQKWPQLPPPLSHSLPL